MGIRPVVQCPQCERTMRPHCSGWKCGWAFCGVCSITLELKTRRQIGRGY